MLAAQLGFFKVWRCKKAFQGLKIYPQAWCILGSQKNQRHVCRPADIRSFGVREETHTHTDEMIQSSCVTWTTWHGTRRTSHERFRTHETSLYLTDVVVLGNGEDTVNFFGSGDHQDKQGLRGEKQYRAR